LEIFFLKEELRVRMVAWSFCPKDAQSLLFSDTIRERERMRVFPKHSSQIRFFEELDLIRVGDCPPIITAFQGAS